jgi:ABC-type polysaccharide/polyol phosphate transport system ATPase subunit
VAARIDDNAIDVAGVCKRFRFRAKLQGNTLKDLVVRKVHHERGFGVVDALEDVSFSLRRGLTLGVIGSNGSGKTTLLRILAGITKPDRGTVRLQGSIATLLALGAGFNPQLTGRENAMIELLTLGLDRARARAELANVIEFSELGEFIDAPLRTYSSGMIMRLAFAAATRVAPDILLIDEILAVGDERFSAKCAAWLSEFKGRGKTTVLVTHSASQVALQCDLALWLDDGRVAAFGDRLNVVRAYAEAMSGKPVAEMQLGLSDGKQSAAARAESYRRRLAALLPLLRLPLVGFVRQSGTIKGGYEDGWTDGELAFAIEPLRDVRGWSLRATVPAAMPPGNTVAVEVDGSVVSSAPAAPGRVVLRCDVPIPAGKRASVRVRSSATVNHSVLGISDDLRNIGPRVDEIVFDH